MTYPKIYKARFIKGQKLCFRNADVSDAPFILSLRTNSKKSRYLSSVSTLLSVQQTWLREYELRDDEAYFIIESIQGQPVGTVRLYENAKFSFSWGSWIIKDGIPQAASVESALMVYSYALDVLGFLDAHFQVRKENVSVIRFHERFGAKRVDENAQEYFYTISNIEIRASMERYRRFLSTNLIVDK